MAKKSMFKNKMNYKDNAITRMAGRAAVAGKKTYMGKKKR